MRVGVVLAPGSEDATLEAAVRSAFNYVAQERNSNKEAYYFLTQVRQNTIIYLSILWYTVKSVEMANLILNFILHILLIYVTSGMNAIGYNQQTVTSTHKSYIMLPNVTVLQSVAQQKVTAAYAYIVLLFI